MPTLGHQQSRTLHLALTILYKGPTFVSYVPGYVQEEPISGFSVAQVVKSDNEKFKDGELIAGVLPFAEYAIIPVEVS